MRRKGPSSWGGGSTCSRKPRSRRQGESGQTDYDSPRHPAEGVAALEGDRLKGDFKYDHWSLPRTDLVELIPPGTKRVLDVGCGVGKTGSILVNMGFERTVGVEIHAEAAQKAKDVYDEVLVLDVEKQDLPCAKGYFDCILYGDVLEHLTDPWRVLRNHRDYLSEEGIIVCSIPNVRYYRVLLPLILQGRWEYEDIGVLDRSHLRFFTLKTIEDLLRNSGFTIVSVVKKKRCGKFMRFLNHLFFDRLIDFLVPQYRIVGAKGDEIEGSGGMRHAQKGFGHSGQL